MILIVKKMRQILILLVFSTVISHLNAQDPFSPKKIDETPNSQFSILNSQFNKEYSFIIQDDPTSLFTVRQSNENFLNIYRLAINEINRSLPGQIGYLFQTLFNALFFCL